MAERYQRGARVECGFEGETRRDGGEPGGSQPPYRIAQEATHNALKAQRGHPD
jgi:hypothetical protein